VGGAGHDLFLGERTSTAFDHAEIGIDFIGTINIKIYRSGQRPRPMTV